MSSNDIVISVKNISKCFEIYDRPSDRLKQFLLPKIQRLLGIAPRQYYREFSALDDVSFEVKRGETVGIIGLNGSGKSTLLQMICGTLTPTAGHVKINGRIAALLELGSGFNPEFTGRENVYLNASVLGLSNEEINQRYDQIVKFADIGDFIDQPVKTYSSGMMVRLAFAVIAHVDADILVVDEALAVGDAVFTQKCMRFIRKFKERGTLLFVSHDISSVLNLCERVLWLHNGQVRKLGEAKDISEIYLQFTLQAVYGQEAELKVIEKSESAKSFKGNETEKNIDTPVVLEYLAKAKVQDNLSQANGWKTGAGEITSVQMLVSGKLKKSDEFLQGGETVKISISAVAHEDMVSPILGFLLRDKLGQDLFGENTFGFTNLQPLSVKAGNQFQAEFTFKLPMLPNGDYTVMTSLADGDLYDHVQHHWLHNALIIQVMSSKVRYGLVGVEFNKISLLMS